LIDQGGFPVIDMSDDCDIADAFHTKEKSAFSRLQVQVQV